MIEIGKYNTLKAVRSMDQGFYLSSTEEKEVLLPNKYVPEDFAIGDLLEVFVYKDSEDRIVATTKEPYVMVGEFAYLKANAITKFGAFLDWGLEKDLLVPFNEQINKMEEGRGYVIYAYLDEKTERIVATQKYNKRLQPLPEDYNDNQEVELLISKKTDLGFEAIIDDIAKGLIYNNEIFSNVKIGDRLDGFIKAIRPDGKIDLALQQSGKKHVDETSKIILNKLIDEGGHLPYHDKTDSETIKKVFGISKKAFKKSIGALYKKKMIQILEDGIKIN